MISFHKHIVFPGQFVITSVPSLITTVLGSCVSVCLWDKKTKVAGMNHYLLPGSEVDERGNANRGHSSIRLLLRSMLNRQVQLENMEAKIFGGCNSLYKDNDCFRVCEQNILMAVEVLREYDIRIVAQHTGGNHGRKIVFNTATGKVRMRLLSKITGTEINEEIHKGFGY